MAEQKHNNPFYVFGALFNSISIVITFITGICRFFSAFSGIFTFFRPVVRLITGICRFFSAFSGIFTFFRPVMRLNIVGVNHSHNPLKGKPKNPVLSEKKQKQVHQALSNFVTYDAENTQSVVNFEQMKQNSECIFAKKAKVWGSASWDSKLSLEENIYRSLPTFLKFTLVCQDLGLDMFIFELPGNKFGDNVHVFGDAVRRVLQVISDNDPKGYRSMDKSYIDRKGWVFEFNRVTFFITTFAPFYPSSNSRYSFGCDNCYISLQPEISFAQNDLPPDTPLTEWDCPVTVRDRIRIAFKKAGRPYLIRDTIYYPMAHDIVKAVDENDPLVEWWKKSYLQLKKHE